MEENTRIILIIIQNFVRTIGTFLVFRVSLTPHLYIFGTVFKLPNRQYQVQSLPIRGAFLLMTLFWTRWIS